VRVATGFFILVISVFGVGCEGGAAESTSDSRGASSSLWPDAVMYNGDHDFFALDRGTKKVNLATGALYCSERNKDLSIRRTDKGNTVRVTCGLTFISPRYAITAAHCIDDNSCGGPGMSFTVRQFDVSALDTARMREATALRNVTDSDYENWQFSDQLTPADGYRTTDYTCVTKAICSSAHGERNNELCPTYEADISLLYCPERPKDAAYVDVATDVKLGDRVRTHWFFELSNFPLPGSCDEPECDMVNQFYNTIVPAYINGADTKKNFHYIGFGKSRETQLFPLVSVPWGSRTGNESGNSGSLAPLDASAYGQQMTDSVDVVEVDTSAASEIDEQDSNSPADIPDTPDSTERRLSDAEYAALTDATGIHVLHTMIGVKGVTDIFGCHGTSGAGMFQVGKDGEEKLIGPVTNGGVHTSVITHICDTIDAQKGQSLLMFALPNQLKQLVDYARTADGV
jgi:hypothetical protein